MKFVICIALLATILMVEASIEIKPGEDEALPMKPEPEIPMSRGGKLSSNIMKGKFIIVNVTY